MSTHDERPRRVLRAEDPDTGEVFEREVDDDVAGDLVRDAHDRGLHDLADAHLDHFAGREADEDDNDDQEGDDV